MRIRITLQPSGEVDGIALERFSPGQVYEVGAALATYLTSAGWAEPLIEPVSESAPRHQFRLNGCSLVAFDYDGTVATGGQLTSAASEGLRRLRASGRRAVLVTGRELDDLLKACPEIDLFDQVVAENGAVSFTPGTRRVALLADRPPPLLHDALRRNRVPFSAGRVIVSTRVPHDARVIEIIKELELDLHVIYNREAVMILPSGVSKASGLASVLNSLSVPFTRVLAVGDAENDRPLLRACGYRAAVANAVESLKSEAHIVTRESNGRGVLEIVEAVVGTT